LGDKADAVAAFQKSYQLNPMDAQLKAWLDKYGAAQTGASVAPQGQPADN
jgi:hypothetical protein